jgi:hypothetical protein
MINVYDSRQFAYLKSPWAWDIFIAIGFQLNVFFTNI